MNANVSQFITKSKNPIYKGLYKALKFNEK